MGFFKKDEPYVAPAPEPIIEEKRSLFGKKTTVVHEADGTSHTHSGHARRQSVDTHGSGVVSPTSPVGHHASPNARLDEINSVLPAAREKVAFAEQSEARARQALKEAELAVLEARKHVKALEQEAILQAKAAEQAARDANAKLSEVSAMKKRTGKMGRV